VTFKWHKESGSLVVRKSALLVLVLSVLLAVTGAITLSSPQSIQAAGVAEQALPRVEATDCSAFEGLDVSGATVQCGYLVVPENRQNPQSRTIKVAYTIVKAHGPNPQPDPVVYLTGGPGDNAIRWLDTWAGVPINADRDIILVDPRGVGNSQPAMQCPANTPPGVGAQAKPPAAGDSLAQRLQWAQSCRDLLVSQGFDLTAYNSIANASDLNDLRQALGYAQWNLYGTSYGTRVALVTMRAYPDGIRSAVLDSVLPPQVDRIGRGDLNATTGALSALFAACKSDPACDHDYPNLETKFDEAIQHLDLNPIKVTVPDGGGGKTKQVWITGATIVAGIKAMLMSPYFIQIAPVAIEQIRAGNTTVIERLYANLASGDNPAIYNTVLCHDVGALFDPEQFHADLEKYPALKSFYAGDEQAAICRIWGAGQAAPAESQPVQSDIPTLLLTGGAYDFASSVNSKLAATTLSHHFLYEFPAYSHYVTLNECPQAIMAGFLSDPAHAPDASCMAQIKGLGFVTDVYRNSAALNLFLAAQLALPRWPLALIEVVGLLFLSAVVYLPIAYLRSRRQGTQAPLANAARMALWLVAFLNLAFGFGAWLLAKKALAENSGWVTLFGFSPASSRYLFILPWLAAILTLALLAFAFLAWKRRWWKLPDRVYFTIVTLAAVGFTGLLVSWRLFAS
jgi:pimeloyl-ACP methyl ester carboxylesterase